jgi:hypothetical protein
MLRKILPVFVMTVIALCFAGSQCAAVPKPHVIVFGKWVSAKWPNATEQKLLDLKVRPLFVDTRLKEYTTGTPHELTDRLFVVRRAFRVNDALPMENAGSGSNSNAPRWLWQRGGWLLVDRLTGHVPSSTCPSSIPSIRRRAGIATTSPTAAYPKMARNSMRSSPRWGGASRS